MTQLAEFRVYNADLHLHSNLSDGQLTPKATLELCKKKGINTVSFTEHNFIGKRGLYQSASKVTGIGVIPGIEISTVFNGKSYHLLGYFNEFPDNNINNKLKPMVDGYERRAKKIINQIRKQGVQISYAQIRESYSEIYLSKYAIAEEVCRVLNLASLSEAFNMAKEGDSLFWIKDDFDFIDTASAIELIHNHNGVAVLAHPGSFFRFNGVGKWEGQVQRFVDELQYFIKKGLDGIEVYYPSNTLLVVNKLEDIAGENNLLLTGGSDWHGTERLPDHPIGSGGISLNQLEKLVKRLIKIG